MDADEKELGKKLVTAKDLVNILGNYHKAIARLGSGLISLSSALQLSDDPHIKSAAETAWGKLDDFINYMEGAAESLNALIQEEGPADGE